MEELFGLVIFIVIAVGGALLRRHLEQQQAARHQSTEQDGRPPVRRPVPARSPVPPGAAVARRVIRRKTAAAKPPPTPDSEHPLQTVGAMETRRMGTMEAPTASTLRDRAGPGTIVRREVETAEHRHFLSDALRRQNLARAIILAEIFGPPKGLGNF